MIAWISSEARMAPAGRDCRGPLFLVGQISYDPTRPSDFASFIEESVDGFDEFDCMWQLRVTVECVGILPDGMNEEQLCVMNGPECVNTHAARFQARFRHDCCQCRPNLLFVANPRMQSHEHEQGALGDVVHTVSLRGGAHARSTDFRQYRVTGCDAHVRSLRDPARFCAGQRLASPGGWRVERCVTGSSEAATISAARCDRLTAVSS